MAGPHVAGLVGLLLSAAPALRGEVGMIEDLIEQNAMHISSFQCSSDGVPNNLYGWGRIQALETISAASLHQLAIDKSVSDITASPGQVITYTLNITHTHLANPTANVILTDTLPAGTSFVSATQPYTISGETVAWSFASMAPGESIRVLLAVRVESSAGAQVANAAYTVASDDVAPVSGPSVVTFVQHFLYLPLALK